jgi:multidrug efflux pump subunit AcrA (membrane-fusion protein)
VAGVESIPVSAGKFDGKVEFLMDDGALPLVPGMNAKVKLTGYENNAALTVPTSAIFSEEADETQKYVYVFVDGGEPEKRTVETGNVSGENTEITGGLEEGEQILLEKPSE